jgi:hypothetical protein
MTGWPGLEKPMITATLTPEQFAAKAAELKAKENISIVGTAGTISRDGVQLTYKYDGKVLGINVDHAPPFMTGHVTKALTDWLAAE